MRTSMSRLAAAFASASLLTSTALAHPPSEHAPSVDAAQAPVAPRSADSAAVEAVLQGYKAALERLDGAAAARFFTDDAEIVEGGKVEGTFADYLARHLGPELREFRAFVFPTHAVQVGVEGRLAFATEQYTYRITTRTGEIVERVAVSTSVLRRTPAGWRIVRLHQSSRRPPGSSAPTAPTAPVRQ